MRGMSRADSTARRLALAPLRVKQCCRFVHTLAHAIEPVLGTRAARRPRQGRRPQRLLRCRAHASACRRRPSAARSRIWRRPWACACSSAPRAASRSRRPASSSIRTRSAWSKSSTPRTCSSRSCTTPSAGPLRVVADPTYGRVLLAPLVPRFLESFPDVPLDVSLHAVDAAQARGTSRSARACRTTTTVEHRLLGALPAVLCATPQYLQQRGTPARPEDLRQHDLFTPESDRPDLFPARVVAQLAARRSARRAAAHRERPGRAARLRRRGARHWLVAGIPVPPRVLPPGA